MVIVVSVCYLRLSFHCPLINCVHSAVTGKGSLRFPENIFFSDLSYLATHVEAPSWGTRYSKTSYATSFPFPRNPMYQ